MTGAAGVKNRMIGKAFVLGAAALLASPAGVGPASALLLCEDVADVTCREDVESELNGAISSLVAAVLKESDRRSAVNELNKARTQLNLARLEVADADASLTEEQVCTRAGDQDDRALKQITRGVGAAEKISASKYASSAARTAARAALRDLVQSAIDAVADNADQVEALTGISSEIVDAHKRLFGAQVALDQDRLAKAADGAQRAYDVIRDQGNVATCLDNQQ